MSQQRRNRDIIKCYLLILATVLIGLIPFVATSKLKLPSLIHFSYLTFVVLLVMNIGLAYLVKVDNEIRSYWGVRKVVQLPLAIVAGCIIGCSPTLLSLIAGRVSMNSTIMGMHLSFWSALTTLIIVICEELWFRGLILNYCSRYMSAFHLSVVVGLLFMSLHFLNPEINMLQSGPTLFLAGAFLTLSYLHFRTIWIPICLHYGNNYFGHLLKAPADEDVLWGSDGYITAVVLLLCFITLLMWNNKQRKMLIKG